MKEYEITIDLGSKNLTIKANNKEEAKQKAIQQYEEYIKNNPMTEEYWISECNEVL